MTQLFKSFWSSDNPKAEKAQKYGWLNGINYGAPHTLAGVGNMCPNASPGCIKLCLGVESGNAKLYDSVLQSRIAKIRMFALNRKEYMSLMVTRARSIVKKAEKANMKLCLRPNGSTDIPYEAIKANESGNNIMEIFPTTQFADYTKSFKRMVKFLSGRMPNNYHLVFSYNENNEDECRKVLAMGGQVAVCFAYGLPKWFLGHKVVNGDIHDLIHLQPMGHVIGLSPKGAMAKADTSGFVVRDYYKW